MSPATLTPAGRHLVGYLTRPSDTELLDRLERRGTLYGREEPEGTEWRLAGDCTGDLREAIVEATRPPPYIPRPSALFTLDDDDSLPF